MKVDEYLLEKICKWIAKPKIIHRKLKNAEFIEFTKIRALREKMLRKYC